MSHRTIPAAGGPRAWGWHVAAACVLLLGCGPDPEPSPPDAHLPAGTGRGVSVVDDAGLIVALPTPATRIVSLLPATTEALVALGAGGRLVARTDYDEDPSLAHLPSLGGGLTPSLERIAALRPDLVIAWEEAGGARVRPRLEALGIPVFAAATRDTADIFANLERLGSLTGLEARADSLAAAMRRELDAVRRSVEGRRGPAVLYLTSVDPPMVAGPGLFIGQLLEVAGGRNVFPEAGAASPQVSLEEILRRRPEVVLLAGEQQTLAERISRAPGWRELAASGTRFVALPADLMHRPGPRIPEAARVLRDALHPPGTRER